VKNFNGLDRLLTTLKNITLSQACGRENGKIRLRADPKPLNRSTQNLKQVIMSARRPPVQNFVQIRSLGASRQMGEI